MAEDPEGCAREILETVPLVMAAIRTEMRRTRGSSLSIPQFRTLLFIGRRPEASLSQAADHIGLTLPSMSKLVDGLVASGLASRGESSKDRRQLTLSLTDRGAAALRHVRAATLRSMTRQLGSLPSAERAEIGRAMRALGSLFGSDGGARVGAGSDKARKQPRRGSGTRTSRETRARKGLAARREEMR